MEDEAELAILDKKFRISLRHSYDTPNSTTFGKSFNDYSMYSHRKGLFVFDTCQTKNKVYTEVLDSYDGDSGTSSFSRYSWQYDGYFSAFVLFVCTIIVFIILLVVI